MTVLNAAQWVESLRVVYCLSGKEFETIFGKHDAQYLTDKFFDEYKRDVFKFLCYLDNNNQKLIFDYVVEKMRKHAK